MERLNKLLSDKIKEDLCNELGYAMYPSNYINASTYTMDKFKEFLTSNKCPTGITFWFLNINGTVSFTIVAKANNNYLSFIEFGYNKIAKQYRYLVTNGWFETSLA